MAKVAAGSVIAVGRRVAGVQRGAMGPMAPDARGRGAPRKKKQTRTQVRRTADRSTVAGFPAGALFHVRSLLDKGKPIERWGRKAKGLDGSPPSWQPVPETKRGQPPTVLATSAARKLERAWDTCATCGPASADPLDCRPLH
jgi:hypothetical protein